MNEGNAAIKINTALFSVTDKTGLKEFAAYLLDNNPTMEIIASGGTAAALGEAGITTVPIEKYTGFPECFEGRVKTLHPHIAGGILFKRGTHDLQAEELGIRSIDLVVCNLYPFSEAAKNGDMSIDDLIEYMDIGGSTLIRASIKNHSAVAIVTDPADYPWVMRELAENGGSLPAEARQKLAVKAIKLSASYEGAIASELSRRFSGDPMLQPAFADGKKLRYGENPDQEAWVFQLRQHTGIAQAEVLSGKELSYNNYEDATAAYGAVQELSNLDIKYGVSVIKHGSLCGFASGPTLEEAFIKGWEGDSKSAFGSVICFSAEVGASLVPHLKNKFIEVIIAPGYDEEFLAWAKEKRPNLRVLRAPRVGEGKLVYKNVSGGMLIQTKKELRAIKTKELLNAVKEKAGMKIGVVTKRQPEGCCFGKFAFSIAAVNYAKSNATVVVREWSPGYYQVIGVGAGQPNRVDSLQRLAVPKAVENLRSENGHVENYDPSSELESCVLATDGFFPFDDSVRYAAGQGIKYCIQPGGAKNDEEVIRAADELGMCMVFTGERYFTH